MQVDKERRALLKDPCGERARLDALYAKREARDRRAKRGRA